MSGPHRNPDKLNTIGIAVVGICGAVLVYTTIVALQAFYMNDTSEIQTMADYGGNANTAKAQRADQMRNISEFGMNPAQEGTYRVPIERAMQLVVESAKGNNATFVPAVGTAICRTSLPIPGRGHPDPTPGLVEGCPGATSATPPAAPAAPAAGAGSGAGSAVEVPMFPTNGNATGGTAGSAASTGTPAPPVHPVGPGPGGHAR
jgi:hypothetical protein